MIQSHARLDLPVTIFLVSIAVLGGLGIPLVAWFAPPSWAILGFAFVFAIMTNLSITTGYHRYYAHKSYEAHPLVEAFLLFFATSAWQGSALKWVSDHRRHHTYVDTDKDPYNINEGFWFAHMGWMLQEAKEPIRAPDLEKSAMLQFQHRYYIPLAIAASFLFPALVGWALGSFWSGLFWGGIARVFLTQHSTFFVNSLCHTLGKRTYSDKITARDSLFVAVLTHGEGYHNFHHTFQTDYRNGIRWYHWDPTKWTIKMFALLGLAKGLKKVSELEILKARLQREEKILLSFGWQPERLAQLKDGWLRAAHRVAELKANATEIRARMSQQSCEKMSELRLELNREISHWKSEMHSRKSQWRSWLRLASAIPA